MLAKILKKNIWLVCLVCLVLLTVDLAGFKDICYELIGRLYIKKLSLAEQGFKSKTWIKLKIYQNMYKYTLFK